MRELATSFRGSVLGLAWIVLIPLIMVAVYTFVFGVVMPSAWKAQSASPLQVPLIFFLGLAIFGFFIEIINRAPTYIRAHTSYVKKVVFPLDLLGWVLVGAAGTRLLISLALLTVFLAVVTGRLPTEVVMLPVLLAPFAVLMLGLAWIMCAVGTYLRDLGHVITAISPVIMFISPVFYSVQQVPEQWRGLYFVNPLTFILETARQVVFFGGTIDAVGYASYWLAAVAVFLTGYAFFQRARQGFADVV